MYFVHYGTTIANVKLQMCGCFCPRNWLPWQHALGDWKNNFRSFIYSHSSTINANSVKIGLVDAEIIGLREIVKNIKKETNSIL